MKRILFLVFLYTPDKFLHVFLSVAAYFRSIWRVLRNLRLDVERYSGNYNGQPVTIGYIGSGEMKEYILTMLYNKQWQVTKLSDAYLLDLQKRIDELSNSCDIVFIEQFKILPAIPDFIIIMPNVNTYIKVSELKNPESAHSTRERRYTHQRRLKLIAKSGVEFREFKIAEHPEKLKYFYEKLYAPHIANTYGKDNVESFDWLKIFYAKGFLRLAYLDNTIISGVLFLQQNDTLIFCKYGVLDPDNKIHRVAGSIQSHLQHAEEKQIPYYSGFHARPFFTDGVFHYKRTSGLGVERESRNYYFDTHLYINVLRYSPAVIDFLHNNPFIFDQNGTLVARFLCKEDSENLPEKIIELCSRYRTEGIDQYQFHIAREITTSEKELIYQKCGLTGDKHRLAFLTYRAEK